MFDSPERMMIDETEAQIQNSHAGIVKPPSELTDDDFIDGPSFSAHWHIFIPSLIIIVAYGTGLGIMNLTGAGQTALARLFMIVLAIGVPLLLVHAILRFYTIRVEIGENYIRMHEGWPRRLPVDMPKQMIAGTIVRRGLSGRLMGGGTMIVKLITDDKVVISDLNDPDGASMAVDAAVNAPEK